MTYRCPICGREYATPGKCWGTDGHFHRAKDTVRKPSAPELTGKRGLLSEDHSPIRIVKKRVGE